MKLFSKPLFILLPAALAASASAQVARSVLPGGSNPFVGAPIRLPGPGYGLIAGMRIELPAPRLDPSPSMVLAGRPAVIAASLPALPMPRIPSRPIVPIIRPVASRENVAYPLTSRRAEVFPMRVRETRREALENLFDGRRRPAQAPAAVPSRKPAPIRPAESVGIPEQELEAEIGVL